jgi:REP element-mobilizing transposase RayT
MPARNQEFQAGEYYHIYHRGANRQKIFFEAENHLYFLRLLNKYREKFVMNVVAYCLMSNHFHFQRRRRMRSLGRRMARMKIRIWRGGWGLIKSLTGHLKPGMFDFLGLSVTGQ